MVVKAYYISCINVFRGEERGPSDRHLVVAKVRGLKRPEEAWEGGKNGC